MTINPSIFAEKYLLARKTAITERPQYGLVGYELEWNLLDPQLNPLLTVAWQTGSSISLSSTLPARATTGGSAAR